MLAQTFPAAAVISDARLSAGYDYWRRKAAGRSMPRRADIDPTEMPRLLPYVRLVDVLGPGLYRYRLIGTEVQQLHGTNPTGRFVHEVLTGPSCARILAVYDECVRDRRPIYFENLFLTSDRRESFYHSKVVFAPLSEDGETVSQVLVFQILLNADPRLPLERDPWTGPYREIVHVPL